MTRLRRWLSAIVAALVAAGLLQGPLQPAEAAAGNPAYCSPQVDKLDNRKFGKDIPVILVHGIQGSSVDWAVGGSGRSFYDTLDSLPYVSVAQAFDYDAEVIDLITPETIHPAAEKLAATIHCASTISKRSGGQGKVIVVGHSLGGLVTRLALSYNATDKNGKSRKVSGMVSQVVTIGTPHRGLGDAATRSAIAAIVPKFPANVNVLAIAGDVTEVETRNGVVVKAKHLKGDGLVPVNSATNGHSKQGTAERESYVYECQREYPKGATPPAVDCHHDWQIKLPSHGIRGMVVSKINVRAQANRYGERGEYTIGNLIVSPDDRWGNAGDSINGPGMDFGANDLTNGAKCTNCEERPKPTVYPSIYISHMTHCLKSVQECAAGDLEVLGAAPNIRVGGKKPDVALKLRWSDHPAGDYGYMWCFSSTRVCIDYRRSTPGKNLKISDAFRDLMANAKWAK